VIIARAMVVQKGAMLGHNRFEQALWITNNPPFA